MKKILLLTLFVISSVACMAFYPAYRNLNGESYDKGVMMMAHDDIHVYASTPLGLIAIDKETGREVLYSRDRGNFDYTPSVIAMHDGTLYIGTSEGQMACLRDGEMTPFPIALPRVYDIRGIAFDSAGNMFVNQEGWVYSVDRDGKGTQVLESFNEWSSAFGMSWMKFDRKDNLWAAFIRTVGPCVPLMKYAGGKEAVAFEANFRVQPYDDGAYALAIDADDNVWCSFQNRLVKIHDEQLTDFELGAFDDMDFDARGTLWCMRPEGTLVSFDGTTATEYPCPISTERWLCLDIDGDDIYIGTAEGIVRFHDGQFTTFSSTLKYSQTAIASHTASRAIKTAPAFDLGGRRVQAGSQRGGVVVSHGSKRLR